jgi:hypothetical protein
MTTQATPNADDQEMPAEIDFSGAVRGKFFKADAQLNVPLYLEPQVQAYLTERAQAKGVGYAQLVNELLKKDIELIEAAR